MNNEKKLQLWVFVKLLVVCICAGLYAWGGMEMKWLRRFLAPGIACIFAFFYSGFNWRYLIQMPLQMVSLSMGYGADVFWHKVLRRGLFGLCNGVSSSTVFIWKKQMLTAGFQIALLLASYILIGVWNPLPNARVEETVLGFLVFFITVMGVEKKEA